MEYAVVMAGGIGTRLWPASRRQRPKQLLNLVGESSFFQQAIERVSSLLPLDRLLVVAREDLVLGLSRQVPEIPIGNFVAEPEGRGTASAIGLAAVHLLHRDPDAVMMVLAADHFIACTQEFVAVLSAALRLARLGHLITLGIKPAAPRTGYGYIEQGELLGSVADLPFYRVSRFTEKPDASAAVRMVESGRYLWNSGMFVWSVARIMEEFRQQTPELFSLLDDLSASLRAGRDTYLRVLADRWGSIPSQAIDYAVMEGAEDVVVIPADIGWSDVGSWESVYDLLAEEGAAGNACVGNPMLLDTHNTLVFSGGGPRRLVAAIGLEDMMIIDVEDALLVCPRSREQDVRRLVDLLKSSGRNAWL